MRVDDERSKEGHLDEGHVEVEESHPGLDVVFVAADNLWVHFFSDLSNTGQHHLRLILVIMPVYVVRLIHQLPVR